MFEALKLKSKLVLVSILEQLPVRGIVNSGYIFNKKERLKALNYLGMTGIVWKCCTFFVSGCYNPVADYEKT